MFQYLAKALQPTMRARFKSWFIKLELVFVMKMTDDFIWRFRRLEVRAGRAESFVAQLSILFVIAEIESTKLSKQQLSLRGLKGNDLIRRVTGISQIIAISNGEHFYRQPFS